MEKLQKKLLKQHKNMENSIIDLIIRIKNGYMAKKETIESPHSKYKDVSSLSDLVIYKGQMMSMLSISVAHG